MADWTVMVVVEVLLLAQVLVAGDSRAVGGDRDDSSWWSHRHHWLGRDMIEVTRRFREMGVDTTGMRGESGERGGREFGGMMR